MDAGYDKARSPDVPEALVKVRTRPARAAGLLNEASAAPAEDAKPGR